MKEGFNKGSALGVCRPLVFVARKARNIAHFFGHLRRITCLFNENERENGYVYHFTQQNHLKPDRLLVLLLCGGLLIPAPLLAKGMGSAPNLVELRVSSPVNLQQYNAQIKQLIFGSILKTYIVEYQTPNGSYRVIGMDIKTSDGKIYYTHLAPPNIFIKQGFKLNKGESIIVRGVIMNIDQHPILIANMLSHRGQSIKLRTERGMPKWGTATQLGRSELSQIIN